MLEFVFICYGLKVIGLIVVVLLDLFKIKLLLSIFYYIFFCFKVINWLRRIGYNIIMFVNVGFIV